MLETINSYECKVSENILIKNDYTVKRIDTVLKTQPRNTDSLQYLWLNKPHEISNCEAVRSLCKHPKRKLCLWQGPLSQTAISNYMPSTFCLTATTWLPMVILRTHPNPNFYWVLGVFTTFVPSTRLHEGKGGLRVALGNASPLRVLQILVLRTIRHCWAMIAFPGTNLVCVPFLLLFLFSLLLCLADGDVIPGLVCLVSHLLVLFYSSVVLVSLRCFECWAGQIARATSKPQEKH